MASPRRARRRLAGRAWVTLVGGICLGGASLSHAQISPGPLAHSHKDLEGILKCLNCHEAGKKAMDDKCLACHEDISYLRARNRGLHSVAGIDPCASCHPDHAGGESNLIRWDEGSHEQFDHNRSGWPLKGTHIKVKCRECHQPSNHVPELADLGEHSNPRERWTGLDPRCHTCHEDAHRGALGQNCLGCHEQEKWKPAPLFDHSGASFPLRGKHASVECPECHQAPHLKLPLDLNGQPVPLYKPLPSQECSSCHKDLHEGRLGADCSRCHTSEGWHRVRDNQFNHDTTRYPLRGAHRNVKCVQCHDPTAAWGRKPPLDRCMSCHQDPHAGKATLEGKKVDCETCHSENSWNPSTYTVKQHARSAYPLKGKHRDVACSSCHLKNPPILQETLGPAGVLLRAPKEPCRACHEDDHGEQLASRNHKGACETCHDVYGFKPSTFGEKEHAKLEFSLIGRHAKIECAACHGPTRPGLPPLPAKGIGRAKIAVVLEDSSCTSCHADPHDGRFGPKGERPTKTGCIFCHNHDVFHPSTIDMRAHDTFAFPLRGAHRAVPCNSCHEEAKLPHAKSSLLLARDRGAPKMPFTTKDQNCAGCHEDPHGAQFAESRDDGSCDGCHSDYAFRPAHRFDHNRDTEFSLEGAHISVNCDKCHPTRKGSGRDVVVYRPLNKDCKSCHGGRMPGPLSFLPDRRQPRVWSSPMKERRLDGDGEKP